MDHITRGIPHPVYISSSTKNIFYVLLLLFLLGAQSGKAQQYNKGIGVYPGNPKENFAPAMRIDAVHYRDLAINRAAYQSSSYDYNLTAQLITDGITDAEMPAWIVTSTSSRGILPRDGREHVIDRHGSSQEQLDGPNVWVQVQMAGAYVVVPPVDSLNISANISVDTLAVQPWTITLSGSDDGVKWDELGKVSGDNTLPGVEQAQRFRLPPGQKPTPQQAAFIARFASVKRRSLNYGFKLKQAVHYKYYRFSGNSPNVKNWTLSDMGFLYRMKATPIGGPYHFSSSWKSAGSGTEWVYVDLGAVCDFNDVKLDWVSPAVEGSLQVSNDAQQWQDVAPLAPNTSGDTTVEALNKPTKARYVRVLMTKPANAELGYILGEIEVMGTGGPVPVPHAQDDMHDDGSYHLSGGAWKLQRASMVHTDGIILSEERYKDDDWLVATVPGTSLVSYVNDGAVPEPNYGDNNVMVSDSYFYDDFWYRDSFTVPPSYKGGRVFLNFDGINWRAEVYLNGNLIGHIDGAFTRAKFDVTNLLVSSGKNFIAVRVLKNATPGFPTEQNRNSTDANGGEIGADDPTFHASIGWDWIPTIRGRNTGIWNDVYLSPGGPVSIENPLVTCHLPLPDTTSADINMEMTVVNHSNLPVDGTLHGRMGTVSFAQHLTLKPMESRVISLDPKTNPSFRMRNPQLWWPNGYGNQNMYDVVLSFITTDYVQSDIKLFKTGLREMTYSEADGKLKMWVNGKRFIPRGGNWGFGEDLLRYRSREFDVAVGYHKDMNFNMIRNWVGQIGDNAFFEACDKYGIMIWQDFWLANPSDGPEPDHPQMFINNMKDFVKRIRNHPSIALFVGRNEGNPPRMIEDSITTQIPLLVPGLKYIPNSASGSVSGGGPYALQPLKAYFQNRATPRLHSEMGTPDVMSYESFKLTMPDSDISPQSRMWGVHDFTLQGAQNGGTFNKAINQSFGKVDDVKKWLSLAAWTEYQGYRAMFEAQSKNRMGLLIWISHPSWPTLVWQSYDYYFEPTGAYFGGKKASEPLHIQWNQLTDSIEVVNYSVPNGNALTARLQVVDMDGTVKFTKETTISCPEDSTAAIMPVSLPTGLSSAYFVRLQLTKGNMVISSNDYCRGAALDSLGGIGDLKAITSLPQVNLTTQTQSVKEGDHWVITTQLVNKTPYVAFNVRLKVTGATSGNRILPVIYDDNYFSLLPGESRTVAMKVADADTQGEKPDVVVEGFNVK